MRKTSAVDYENITENNLNTPFVKNEKKNKYLYLLLPITHGLSIGLGIIIGLKISSLDGDGSL